MRKSDSTGARFSRAVVPFAFLTAVLAFAEPTYAYIGPGAGFALLSSFLVLFTTIILALFSLLLLPFRALLRLILRKTRPKPWIERLIVVGFDGQDPKITEKLMQQGKLPNFKRLAELGCYSPLPTTFPSISPVAWSSFSTGTNPARHNIFDFLDRDRRTYLPVLSSTHIGGLEKFFKLGRSRIPFPPASRRLDCSGSPSPSGPSWASTIFGARSSGCQLLFPPIASTAHSTARCACRICWEPRVLSSSSPPAPLPNASRKGACASLSSRTEIASRRRSRGPRTCFARENRSSSFR